MRGRHPARGVRRDTWIAFSRNRPTIAETERAINKLEKCDSMPAKLIIVRHLLELAVRDAVRECSDFVMNWRNEDGNQQFGHYVIASALRQKFNIEENIKAD